MRGSARTYGSSAAIGLATLLALVAAAPTAASTVQAQSGGFQIVGDNNDDAITVSGGPTAVTVVDTGTGGLTPGTNCVAVNAQTATCTPPPGGVPFFFFFVGLGSGTDSFVNVDVNAGGNIGPFGPDSGAKTISGGPGDQGISGGSDSDLLDGGPGNDQFFDGGGSVASPTGGDDTLIGGPDEDTARYFRETDVPLTVKLDGLANDGQAGEADNVQTDNVITDRGNDLLVGDAAPNELVGSTGADQIFGLGGNDRLVGDFGGNGMLTRGLAVTSTLNDVLDGGPGRDDVACGGDFDLVLHDPFDEISPDCERTGALLDADSAGLGGKKHNKAKIGVECPTAEDAACTGTLILTANDKQIGKGSFNVAPGTTKRGKAKLSKKGLKAVANANGTLLASVTVSTTEPGGVAESSGRILIYE